MEKLRLAVIGVNSRGIGNVYVKSIIENPWAEIVAICDNVEEKVRERFEKFLNL